MLAEVKRRVTLLKDHLQAEYRSTDDPFCIPCSNRASPRMLKRNETCDGLSLAALEGNPTYYATRDPSTLPEDLQKLVKAVEEADAYLGAMRLEVAFFDQVGGHAN